MRLASFTLFSVASAIGIGLYSQTLDHASPLQHTHHQNMLAPLMPKFLNKMTAAQKEKMRQEKTELFQDVKGNVIEIGVGTGANFEFMPWNQIESYTVVEPNEAMFPYIKDEVDRLGLKNIHYILGPAENITDSPLLPQKQFDSVVSTLVDNVPRSVEQYKKLLVPGGKYYFLEHVAAPDGSFVRSTQRVLRWVWNQLFDGCWIDRETEGVIKAAGFVDIQTRPGFLAPIIPTIIGSAKKPQQ
eukprot:TRINITY_DN2579_c0_g2_i1.p2 TRINITY_DN2579_c0_g2~~TRINITY_DN2579_c0_g2_i1.p2  ORF type:complete len:243 (+),score=52.06 TRINITY_DN2579_c0_g2_i1:83-811(+)